MDVTMSRPHPHGPIFLQPHTDAARAWVDAECNFEPWQWQDGAGVIDGCDYANAILFGLIEAGFDVRTIGAGDPGERG